MRASEIVLPEGVELSAHDRDATVASIATSSAMQSEVADEAAAAAAAEAEAEEATPGEPEAEAE
jgi:hypothetical protein